MLGSWFERYLMPGMILQSIVVAGGYGTGRELVAFFLDYGPVGGLLGMLVPATLLTSLIAALSFEIARVTRSYDYRSFFRCLLGRAWWLYEVGYVVSMFLIIGVIGSASGIIASETFGLPGALGALGLLGAIGFLVFKGTEVIERVLSVWSFVLYGAYVTLFAWSFSRWGPTIFEAVGSAEIHAGWAMSGVRYGALTLALVPAMLFATQHITRRREAVVSGLLAGPIVMAPATLFFLAILSQYPAVLERPVPVNHLLEALGSLPFQVAFQIVLFGTLIETGVGLIHAFNERVAGVYAARGRVFPDRFRPLIAVGFLLCGWALSFIGITVLVGRGYAALTWFFLTILVVPVLTVGVRRIRRGA